MQPGPPLSSSTKCIGGPDDIDVRKHSAIVNWIDHWLRHEVRSVHPVFTLPVQKFRSEGDRPGVGNFCSALQPEPDTIANPVTIHKLRPASIVFSDDTEPKILRVSRAAVAHRYDTQIEALDAGFKQIRHLEINVPGSRLKKKGRIA